MAIAASKGAPEFRSDALRMASSDTPPAADDAESGETYKVKRSEAEALLQDGQAQCESGCKLELDDSEAPAPDASAMEAGGA